MLHSQEFLDNINQIKNSEVHAIDKGHWIISKQENENFPVNLIKED